MNIAIDGLSFRYKGLGSATKDVLADVNLEIGTAEFLALIGPSGSGKTTLMQHLTGLLKPDKGTILIEGSDLWAKEVSQTQTRRRIGLVFQFPETQLFEETVYDDVAFGPRNLDLPEDEVKRRAIDAIEAVSLDFGQFKDRSPIHLSAGEKRRVAIAGVLAMKPDVLVLDEPTVGLDYRGSKAVLGALREFQAQGKSLLLISHDLDLVVSLVERIVLINDGRIVYDGPKRDLLRNEQILVSAGMVLPRTQRFVSWLRELDLIESDEIYSREEIKQEIRRRLNPGTRAPIPLAAK